MNSTDLIKLDKLKRDIRTAAVNLTVSRASLDVFWTLSDPARPAEWKQMESRFGGFFGSTREAHRRTMIVTLGTLIDPHERSISFPSLIRRMDAAGYNTDRVERAWTLAARYCNKVWRVRCKVYAHRDGRLTDVELFKKVKLHVWEIRRLTDVMLRILHRLQLSLDMPRTTLSPIAFEDTVRVLRRLQCHEDTAENF